jgi:hypothetical protein
MILRILRMTWLDVELRACLLLHNAVTRWASSLRARSAPFLKETK